MDWLEKLAELRRKTSTTYAETESKIEKEDDGFEIELVGDGEGNPLISPVLVAAGDSARIYHI